MYTVSHPFNTVWLPLSYSGNPGLQWRISQGGRGVGCAGRPAAAAGTPLAPGGGRGLQPQLGLPSAPLPRPVGTGCLPLSCSGNPGVNGVSHRGLIGQLAFPAILAAGGHEGAPDESNDKKLKECFLSVHRFTKPLKERLLKDYTLKVPRPFRHFTSPVGTADISQFSSEISQLPWTPLRCWLSTPESQWQSRGQTAYPTGVGGARLVVQWRAQRDISCTAWYQV
jgi:hypothetical protein